MQLSELFEGEGDQPLIDICGLALDSREVEPGFLFAALPGSKKDGRDFIPEAIERGAVAVLTGLEGFANVPGIVQITDPEPRRRLAHIAAKFYGAQPECIAAVTGTNGKTSVANFVYQIWTGLGRAAACIGTLGVESPNLNIERGLTTPDSITLQRTLSALAASGTTHVVLEASSHGITQCRLDGVAITIAAFTNLSREHLDYHDTIEQYFASKARLFEKLLPSTGTAVINLDGAKGVEMARILQARSQAVLGVGQDADDICIRSLEPCDDSSRIVIDYLGESHEIQVPLIGEFQAANAILAAAIVIASGEEVAPVFGALEHLMGVSGRLELAGVKVSGGRVFIDYAHTPDGLENILRAARGFTSGSLAVVFGCGGDRDRGKRAEMGDLAQRLADRVYITDDNPRSEDPAAIRREILVAAPEASEFDDRTSAIRAAISELGANDTLLVTGKGHETGQIVGDEVLPFNDYEVVRQQLTASEAGAGQ
jgi:UDP-N-acetylmuramoyl-L-alanyl-D-glutamate--2,6-diaminopimelate ligase